MKQIKNLLKNFDKLEYHVRSVLLSIPISALLLAYLIHIDAADFIFSEWFISIISVPMLLSNLTSVSAHFGRSLDVFTQKNNLSFNSHKTEYTCTIIGAFIGLFIGIGFSAYNLFIPLSSAIGMFANVIFTLRQMNIYAGLGNRMGRLADKNSRPLSEKIIVGISIMMGITLGTVMIATSSAALVSIFGITAFSIGGPTLPVWLGCTIFMLSVTSMLSSAADYYAKGINFIRSYYSKDKEIVDRVKQFKFDYAGSLFGSLFGLVVGGVAVLALCTLSPYVAPGLVGIVSCGLVIVTTSSVFGCIFSQYGRIIDSANRVIREAELEEKQNVEVVVPRKTLSLQPSTIKPEIKPEITLTIRPVRRNSVIQFPLESKDPPLPDEACEANNDQISSDHNNRMRSLTLFSRNSKAQHADHIQRSLSYPSKPIVNNPSFNQAFTKK